MSSYSKKDVKAMADIVTKMQTAIDLIMALEKSRDEWTSPEKMYISLGRAVHIVRKDGTVTPGLEGIQREALKAIDARLVMARSNLEGLRFTLANFGKVAA